MQELSITYPTRTQKKNKEEKKEGKKIKAGYFMLLSCSICTCVQFFPPSF